MVEAGKLAVTQNKNLLNLLCRKCLMKYQVRIKPKDKKEAAKVTEQYIKNKQFNQMLCPRCKKRCDNLTKTLYGDKNVE